MARNRLMIDETKIHKLIKEGRGQNTGADYQPWLTVRDVPSCGFSTRDKGWKTNRVHHVLSNHELDYVYIADWSPIVVDIREQYPLLPLESSLAIAEACGIKHPAHPQTQKPVVLTTDFLIMVSHEGRKVEQARTIKPFAELASDRTLEKLEIERIYWKTLHIDWGIVTEKEIPKELANNVDRIHDRYRQENLELSFDEICDVARTLTKSVNEATLALRHATSACDRRLGFAPGTSLSVAYHLIANRYWLIDMYTPINPGSPLILLGSNLDKLYGQAQ
jgi:hypothetical protein